MSSKINPDSAFVRIYIDIPTPLAIALDEYAQQHGKIKKKLYCEILSQFLASVATPSPKPKRK